MHDVLISGIGIAGPALAHWLIRHGYVPTLVERAPRPRTEGYVIDFWGVGYDIAQKMGLLPDILAAGYRVQEVRIVNDRGARIERFSRRRAARAYQRPLSQPAARPAERHPSPVDRRPRRNALR